MATINIGNSGYINYSFSNNICYNNYSANIKIDSIFFDNLFSDYFRYTINWYAANTDINSSQIILNGTNIINLRPDTYYFTIDSLVTPNSLGPYEVTITSPEKFDIINLEYSNSVCEKSSETDNSDGFVFIEVSGGTPPYTYIFGQNATSENNTYKATGLSEGNYNIDVFDSNGCLANNGKSISIKLSSILVSQISTLPPSIIDSYGYVYISIYGDGPFSFFFDGDEPLYIDVLDTSFLKNHDVENNLYEYEFINSLFPGFYKVTISNKNQCYKTTEINVPNASPISASIEVIPNDKQNIFEPVLSLPIYDTIFIPYSHIKNNTPLWQLFLNKFLKNRNIDFKIDNIDAKYKINRVFLDTYCIDAEEIEILRLGNHEKDWFFCCHVAPGIDLTQDQSLIDSDLKIFDKYNNVEYECVLGLYDNDHISTTYPSLLRGSFIISGQYNSQFFDGSQVNVSVVTEELPETISSDFVAKNIKTNIYYGVYGLAYNFALYFLENFNVLNKKIDIGISSCSLSHSEFVYSNQIKNLLKTINDFDNYQSILIYNEKAIDNIGVLSLFVTSDQLVNQNNTLKENFNYIDYYTFNKNSSKLLSFYKNNEIVKNTNLLSGLDSGYIIIRIRDLNFNIPKFISYNQNTIAYDKHFTSAQNILQTYSPKIKKYFQYGDILAYIPDSYSSVVEEDLPTSNVPPLTPDQPLTNNNFNIVYQSNDSTNSGTLIVETQPSNANLTIFGPKNYTHDFIGKTTFYNMVPGVYYIRPKKEYLESSNLYYTESKVFIEPNSSKTIAITMTSYQDKLFVKE